MSAELSWQRKESTLSLQGELVHNSLLPLWLQRDQLLQGVERIDLGQLSRVDSAGLALLVQLKSLYPAESPLHLLAISSPLQSLIALYNLQDILLDNNSAQAK